MSQFYAPDTGVANEYNYGSENSMVAPLPYSVDYTSPQATGIQKRLKRVIMYPSGLSSTRLGPNDTFRFVMNAQEFLDPMSTVLKFTVDIPTEVLADAAFTADTAYDPDSATYCKVIRDKALQLDDSAQSFISSFRAHCGVGGEDLERIENYDVVAAFLNDVGNCSAGAFRAIDYSGCGGAYGTHFNNIVTATPRGLVPYTTVADQATADTRNYALFKSTEPCLFYDPTRLYNSFPTGRMAYVDTDAAGGQMAHDSNRLMYKRPKYPATVHHIIHDVPNMGFDTPFGDNYSYTVPGTTITVAIGTGTGSTSAVTNAIYNIDTDDDNQDFGLHGSANPFPTNFGKTAFEPIFSNIPQKVILNGIPSSQKVTQMTFMIPVLSGIFGPLMQPNNYKLIPMAAFQNLTFEFKLNPYALFTSYSSTAFQNRRYEISSMELQMDMIEFLDLNVIDATNAALRRGFVLCTQSYYFGPEFAYDNNNIPRSLQINMGFDSMRSLLMVILDNAYKRNTMYRKQYRLSGNITSMQLKIGTEYYPQQPIEGNAGTNYGKINNYDFYHSMLKCFNKAGVREEIGINLHNFAINWRELFYAERIGNAAQNVDSTKTVLNPTKPGKKNTDDRTFEQSVVNIGDDTVKYEKGVLTYQSMPAMCVNGAQMGLYLENRVIGKALFGICCTPANYENNMLEGKNTTIARPFDLLLNTFSTGAGSAYGYPGAASIMIFIYYDLVISFSNATVRALGRS